MSYNCKGKPLYTLKIKHLGNYLSVQRINYIFEQETKI